jgi:hypothetical protein
MPLITRRLSTRRGPVWTIGRCGSIAAYCTSLSQNKHDTVHPPPFGRVNHRAAPRQLGTDPSELVFAPTDPGHDTRHLGTVEPLWTLFDLTPAGRPPGRRTTPVFVLPPKLSRRPEKGRTILLASAWSAAACVGPRSA